MRKTAFVALLCSFTLSVLAQNKEEADLAFYGRNYFVVEGTGIADSLKESPYDRLPLSLKEKVRKPVWDLSKCSAGLSVRFLTDSPRISVKWTLLKDASMNHMADTGIKGVDLYARHNGRWRYVNTGRPSGKENEVELIRNMPPELREYKLFLPLYDGVTDLEIGIEPDRSIRKASPDSGKPIIFYGTSITQGGCASRPGMAHTNIISRRLEVECINLGFSGNGRMEMSIVDLIAGIEARFFVIECLPNMTAEQVSARTLPLVQGIREKQSETPILLVENPVYESAFLDPALREKLEEKNEALRAEYRNIQKMDISRVYYLPNLEVLADHEGTVDGIHLTDLGFQAYAEYLIRKFKELGLFWKW